MRGECKKCHSIETIDERYNICGTCADDMLRDALGIVSQASPKGDTDTSVVENLTRKQQEEADGHEHAYISVGQSPAPLEDIPNEEEHKS